MVADIALTKRIWRGNKILQSLLTGIAKKALLCLAMFGQDNHHHINCQKERCSFRKIAAL
jgi:hypothetical protein